MNTSKKGFKAPFSSPVKFSKEKLTNTPTHTSQKDASLDTLRKGAPISNISAKKSNVSRRNEFKKKLPEVSLTSAEYEEIFNSAIKSVMSMSSSQHSSEGSNNNDKDQENVPKHKRAKISKHAANVAISHTTENNSHAREQHSEKREAKEKLCNHHTQKNKQFGKTTENTSRESHIYNGVKPQKLFKCASKKHEEKLIHEKSKQIQQLPSPKRQAAKASLKYIPADDFSGSYSDDNNENIHPRNQESPHSRPHSGKSKHICSRENTPTHHHMPCRAHSHSPFARENHEAHCSRTHTPCKSCAAARTPHTPCHSHSFGSYSNDKVEDIAASYHRSTCSHTPCSGRSMEREKSSQKCHTHHTTSSQSQPMLSQPPPEYSLQERLLWLQKRRDVGLWVQCSYSQCSKWRYLLDIHDPVEVPEKWYCHMNPDKNFNSCSAPEKGPSAFEEEDLIHNLYTAGSVVWGRLDGYPWWPAMVDDDPDTEQYYWLNGFSDIPTHYNVTFFDDKEVTRAWLTPNALKPFTGKETAKQFRKTRIHGVDYGNRIAIGKSMAIEALQLGIGERRKKFSFLSRFKGSFGNLNTKKRGKQNDNSDGSVSSDDNHSSRKRRFKMTKTKKQTSSGKLHNKEKEIIAFNRKIEKKTASEKRCSDKPEKLINNYDLDSHNEKSTSVQENKSVNSKKNASVMLETTTELKQGSITQSSITQNDEDNDYEISGSQDLFLSQGKNNPTVEEQTKDNEKITNITASLIDVNNTLKNSSQNHKSAEIPQNAEPKPNASSPDISSNKEKSPNVEELNHVAEQTVGNLETTVNAEQNKELTLVETSDAIVPSSQRNAFPLGDAVVPNIQASFGHNRNDAENEHNHDGHSNSSEDSLDFEPEE